jgi:hypothetical protein
MGTLPRMGATASLSQASLAVDAGGEAGLDLQIKNTGTIVDEFTIEILGPTKPWVTIEPPTISLFPEASGTVHIGFRPPRQPTTAAGITPFGVMVHSSEDPGHSAVEEGALHIAPYLEPSAELIPRTSRGSRGGHHEVAIDNRGNVAFDADLIGQDPDRLVGFEFEPPTVSIDPGTAGFAKVKVKPAQTFWRGPSKSRAFQLEVKPHAETQAPLLVAGTMLQEAILPPWFLRAVLTALALLVAAILLWLFVLQPQIKSSAEQVLTDFGFSPIPTGLVAASPSVAASAGVSAAPSPSPPPSAEASPSAGASKSAVPSATGSTSGSATPAPPTGPSNPTPVPTVVPTPSRAVTRTPAPTVTPIIITPPPATAAPSKAIQQFPVAVRLDSKSGQFQAPTNAQVFVTDLVFSNPSGDSGTIVLQVNGKTILSERLDNFRDLDFHFVTPIVVNPGQVMRVVPSCSGTGTCDPAMLFSGYLQPTN